jgi:UDP-glucose 4-epimerase
MKFLVTGGAGFIGSNIVDFLIREGHKVVVVDNESSEAHESFYWNEKAENHKIDICNFTQLKSVMKDVDVVFHLAAEARIQPAILNPIHAVTVNTVGTCNVLQAARESGVKRVVYSSTSSAYGLKNKIPLREDMPKDCLNPYSVSKTAGEELCSMYYTLFGLETVSFRYFNVYGERQPTKGQYAPVIGLFLKQSSEKKPMTIVGDGLQTRDYTHVSDVVKANYLAAMTDNEEALGQIFNVGTGKNHSVIELAEMIGGEYCFIPPRVGESRETLADITKIRKILGWEPNVNLINWIRSAKEEK